MASSQAVKQTISMAACLEMLVEWALTSDPNVPYRAKDPQLDWTLAINDFPAEPLFTLFIGDTRIGNFDDWPERWARPDSPQIAE